MVNDILKVKVHGGSHTSLSDKRINQVNVFLENKH